MLLFLCRLFFWLVPVPFGIFCAGLRGVCGLSPVDPVDLVDEMHCMVLWCRC